MVGCNLQLPAAPFSGGHDIRYQDTRKRFSFLKKFPPLLETSRWMHQEPQHPKLLENITCPCWVLVLSLLWFVNRRLIFRERGNKIWNEISILQRLAEQIDVISLMFLFEYKGGQFKRNYSRNVWVMGDGYAQLPTHRWVGDQIGEMGLVSCDRQRIWGRIRDQLTSGAGQM